MTLLPLSIQGLTAAAAGRGREFAAGWMEGVARHKAAGWSGVTVASSFEPGSPSFAASQAAVTYCLALAEKPPSAPPRSRDVRS